MLPPRLLGTVDERGVDVLERVLSPSGGGEVDHQDHPPGQEVSCFVCRSPPRPGDVIVINGSPREFTQSCKGVSVEFLEGP